LTEQLLPQPQFVGIECLVMLCGPPGWLSGVGRVPLP